MYRLLGYGERWSENQVRGTGLYRTIRQYMLLIWVESRSRRSGFIVLLLLLHIYFVNLYVYIYEYKKLSKTEHSFTFTTFIVIAAYAHNAWWLWCHV